MTMWVLINNLHSNVDIIMGCHVMHLIDKIIYR